MVSALEVALPEAILTPARDEPDMPTVLCLNNYDVGWFAQDPPSSPNHFLYGIDQLHRRGFRVTVCGDRSWRLLTWLQRLTAKAHLPIPLGDLSRQWNALPELRTADLIYSPCDSVVWGLSYLRAAGLLRIPVVCLAHHPLLRGRARVVRRPWVRLALRGIDAFPSLSTAVADEINRLAPGRGLSRPLPWGPDLNYYPPYNPPGRGVVSAGRTGRDFDTLGAAASMTTSPVTIICPASCVTLAFRRFGPNVTVLAHENPIHYTYPQLIEKYTAARAIAIPMVPASGLCGLTSLLDALAMGRAVIMTRNSLIDINIESEGIGFWVGPGDTAGWERAIRFFEEHPAEAEAMGRRARRLAEDRYNSGAFAEELYDIVAGLLHRNAAARRVSEPSTRTSDASRTQGVSCNRTS
jgi:glycosyltransferase involved in cell wall biosynthesis